MQIPGFGVGGGGQASARVTPLMASACLPSQRGNPVLKFVRNIPWEFSEVTPDYVLGQSTCALFLR